MKLEHVLELVKAGFDKDEIMKMVDSGEEVTPEEPEETEKPAEPEETEKPEPAADPKPEPAADPKPEPKQDPYAAYVQAMQKTMDEMRETLKKIQAANVRGTELPENIDEPADILGKAIF